MGNTLNVGAGGVYIINVTLQGIKGGTHNERGAVG